MKVVVNRASLFAALSLANGVIMQRSPKPILQNFLLTAEKGSLSVYGTDLETSVRHGVDQVQVGEPGTSLVPASYLLDIIRNTIDDTVTLERKVDKFVVKSSSDEFKLFVMDHTDYPKAKDATGRKVSLKLCDMQAVLSRTSGSIMKSENARYAMNGALLKAAGNRFDIVSTDGRRLARSWCDASTSKEEAIAIVPAKALSLVAKLDAGKKPEDSPMLEVAFDSGRITFECDGVQIGSGLCEGNFPPYEDVIPKNCDKKATFDRESFLGAVRRASLFVGETTKAVQFEFTKKGLHMSSADPSSGEGDVNFPCKYEGADVTIGFDPKFMLDGLAAARDGEMTLEMTASNRPGLLNGERYKYVITPMNLKE